ncbi:hypothetical protein AA313_de0210238 [Arthrobotrys entomopaga]|nr:hypothetical protein AA313_de0210238 [Arthrobotrys entomopaga]
MASKGTTPPLDVLKTWPKPNYINPENQTGQLMGIEITLCSITTIVTILRLYSRGALTKSIGPDDWLMAGALVCAIGLTITNCLAPQWGWGVHLYDFKPEWLVPARKVSAIH